MLLKVVGATSAEGLSSSRLSFYRLIRVPAVSSMHQHIKSPFSRFSDVLSLDSLLLTASSLISRIRNPTS